MVGGGVRRIAMLAALAAVACGVIGTAQAAPLAPAIVRACPNATAEPGSVRPAALGTATLCLVNRIRAGRRLPALKPNGQLNSFARSFGQRMVRQSFFGHDVPGGPTFAERARSSSYARASVRMSMGENLAWGQGHLGTPASMVQSWMESPGHRANILRRDFRDLGVGVVVRPHVEWGSEATYVHAFGWRTRR